MISFKSKKGLGRGLSSLIGEGKISSSTKASISDLVRNKYQPRKDFEEGNAGWFILAGIIFTVVFVFTVLTVVNLVVA